MASVPPGRREEPGERRPATSPRGHDDEIDAADHPGDRIVYADIAPSNAELGALTDVADQVTILDHHVSSQQRIEAEPELVESAEEMGHELLFDLSHSGAVLTWRYFHPEQPVPDLLRYVEDQDLWSWKLPGSQEVNAAISSYPRSFEVWDELAERPVEELARGGRAHRAGQRDRGGAGPQDRHGDPPSAASRSRR